MVTVDLNLEQKWNEVFQHVEAGEPVQIMRGDRLIALVEPAQALVDQAYLQHLAELGVKQLAETLPPNEFADWNPSNGTR